MWFGDVDPLVQETGLMVNKATPLQAPNWPLRRLSVANSCVHLSQILPSFRPSLNNSTAHSCISLFWRIIHHKILRKSFTLSCNSRSSHRLEVHCCVVMVDFMTIKLKTVHKLCVMVFWLILSIWLLFLRSRKWNATKYRRRRWGRPTVMFICYMISSFEPSDFRGCCSWFGRVQCHSDMSCVHANCRVMWRECSRWEFTLVFIICQISVWDNVITQDLFYIARELGDFFRKELSNLHWCWYKNTIWILTKSLGLPLHSLGQEYWGMPANRANSRIVAIKEKIKFT